MSRFAAGDPANRGTSWGGSSEPSMLWRFSLGLFLDDTIQVARNTGHLSGLERAYVVGGFFLADMIGVRGLSDAFSRHDAAHGHVQSGFERGMDGVFGAVGIGLTAVGLPGAGKAGGIIGKVGSKAAANTVDNVAIEAAEKIAARSMTKAEWKAYNRAQRVAAREGVDLAPNRILQQSFIRGTVHGQDVLYNGARQQRALTLVQESAQAAGLKLSDYVDDVVFVKGRGKVPFFTVQDGRKIIGISESVLRRSKSSQLVAGVHELVHARISKAIGFENYLTKTIQASSRFREHLHEAFVQRMAIQKVERYLDTRVSPWNRVYIEAKLYLADMASIMGN